jgi:hypothetical protein
VRWFAASGVPEGRLETRAGHCFLCSEVDMPSRTASSSSDMSSYTEEPFEATLSTDGRVLHVAGLLDELSVDEFRRSLETAVDGCDGLCRSTYRRWTFCR